MIQGCTNCDDLAARLAALEAQLARAREALRAAGMTGDLANVADAIAQLSMMLDSERALAIRADAAARAFEAMIARMLVAARRSWRRYSREEPNLRRAAESVCEAVERAAKGER